MRNLLREKVRALFYLGGLVTGLVDFLRTHTALAAFACLHAAGLHVLSGARSRGWGAAGVGALLASAIFWVKAASVSREQLGVNNATAALLAAIAALAGVWLLVAGRSAVEWLSGFGVIGGSVSLLLMLGGAKVVAALTLASTGFSTGLAGLWMAKRPDASEAASTGDGATRWAAAIASGGLLLILLGATADRAPTDDDDREATAKNVWWNELTARPMLPLTLAAALVSSGGLVWRMTRIEEVP